MGGEFSAGIGQSWIGKVVLNEDGLDCYYLYG